MVINKEFWKKASERGNDMKIIDLNIKLPHSIYNCYLQQLIMICQLYKNEYWKIFIKYEDIFNNKINYNYKNAMKEYYGLTLNPYNKKLTFKNNEIYLITINSNYYPLCKRDKTLEHYCLIYGETDNFYLINDNYYEKTNFNLDKSLYNQGIINSYLIKNELVENDNEIIISKIIYELENNNYYNLLQELNNIDLNYINLLLDKLKNIIKALEFDSKIINGISNNKYLKECSDIIKNLSSNIEFIYYSFVKEYIKNEKISIEFFNEKIKLLEKKLLIEKKVKEEIIKILIGKESLFDIIKFQTSDFFQKPIDENAYLKEDLDQYSLLVLLSYIELENDIKEINYNDFNIDITYSYFFCKIFKEIITNFY